MGGELEFEDDVTVAGALIESRVQCMLTKRPQNVNHAVASVFRR